MTFMKRQTTTAKAEQPTILQDVVHGETILSAQTAQTKTQGLPDNTNKKGTAQRSDKIVLYCFLDKMTCFDSSSNDGCLKMVRSGKIIYL